MLRRIKKKIETIILWLLIICIKKIFNKRIREYERKNE